MRTHPLLQVKWATPGSAAGLARLRAFCTKERLAGFKKDRNTPTVEATSGLSPYYHFGQVTESARAHSHYCSSRYYNRKAA